MTYKNMEGQMDFLGLLNEYKDSQGASVRVREPGTRRARLSFADEPEQLSFDFGIRVSDGDDTKNFREEKKETIRVKDVNENGELTESHRVSNDLYDADRTTPGSEDFHTWEAAKDETTEEENRAANEEKTEEADKKEIRTADKEEAKPADKEETKPADEETKSADEEINEETKEETEIKTKVENREILKPEASKHKEPKTGETKRKEQNRELLFKQCSRCWCFDCKHNSRNEAVPREMCGSKMACPACDSCLSEDMATICEIGNAKEGCRTRAIEEGIAVVEEYTE